MPGIKYSVHANSFIFTSLNRELGKLSQVTLLGSNRRMICTPQPGSRLMLLTVVAHGTAAEAAQGLGELEISY